MADLARMRLEYEAAGIDTVDLDADPLLQFDRWFNDAVEAGVTEPNAMVLATLDDDGQPWSRYVLLKGVDRGFTFYTNYTSFKSQQLTDHPLASLTFGWLELRRQVVVAGSAEQVPEDESDRYWSLRPRGAQLGAWASRQSLPVADRGVIDAWYEEVDGRFPDDVPRPPHWGGWRIVPHTVEFWQGRGNRLHDRIRYHVSPELTDAGRQSWRRIRLSP